MTTGAAPSGLVPCRLRGARCPACDVVTFPFQPNCPACTSGPMADHLLAERGRLWTWTVQGFAPKPPFAGVIAPFAPYAVGYLDLGGEVLVEGRIVGVALDRLAIGMELHVTRWHMPSADGGAIETYGFAP